MLKIGLLLTFISILGCTETSNTAISKPNTAPTANAGNDTIVGINSTLDLHGTGTDSDGIIISYEWKIGSGQWVMTSNGDTIIAPPGTKQTIICSLRVTDDDGSIDVDEIKVEWRTDGSIVDSIIDADGNKYYSIQIGDQVWTMSNYRCSQYNDYTPISEITDPSDWQETVLGAYCYYNNDSIVNADLYGALYNWHAVNSGKLAPAGWHVPTDAEWTILINYLITNDYNWDSSNSDNKIAKSLSDQTGWVPCSTIGTVGNDLSSNNSTKFSARAGGYRNSSGSFAYQLACGYWWSSTESEDICAYSYCLCYAYENLYCYKGITKGSGLSIRLIRD